MAAVLLRAVRKIHTDTLRLTLSVCFEHAITACSHKILGISRRMVVCRRRSGSYGHGVPVNQLEEKCHGEGRIFEIVSGKDARRKGGNYTHERPAEEVYASGSYCGHQTAFLHAPHENLEGCDGWSHP